MNSPILIIGPDIDTRGVGGVTIYVRRLREYLVLHEVDYIFKDSRGSSFLSLLRAVKRSTIVHLNLSNPVLQVFLVLYGRVLGKKMIMTLHGNYGRFGWIKNQMVKFAIRFATIPIVINDKSYEACKRLNKELLQISAFIPPQTEDPLPDTVVQLLQRIHSEGKKVFSTNASCYALDKYGQDIYGIGFLIECFIHSKNAALVISDPTGSYRKKYAMINSESVYFIDFPHPYFEVLKHVDYFIRNTSTDGDALSVKEALWLGVPSLCTDVVDRPVGVRLFKYCDKESFESSLFDGHDVDVTVENGADRILQVYYSILRLIRN